VLAGAGAGTTGPWAAASTAVDESTLAIAGPAFEAVVFRGGPPLRKVSLDAINDIDLAGDRLALFGLERSESGVVSPDGAIAFVVDLLTGNRSPVLFAASGPGAPAFAGCHPDPSGALRFLPNGDLLVAPGMESGVHLLDSALRPRRSWSGPELPVGPKCPRMLEPQYSRWRISPHHRLTALNASEVIDELVPWADEPWVLVRRTSEGEGTTWSVVRLGADGSLGSVPFPLSSPSPWARLRVDTEGDRLIALIYVDHPERGSVDARLWEFRRRAVAKAPAPRS
jgi:hypothetical protein